MAQTKPAAKPQTANVAPATNDAKVNATAAPAATPETAPEPTSEKLTEIRAKMDSLFASQKTITDRKLLLESNLEIYKLTQDEKTEIANIKKTESELKQQEAKNARIAMVDNLLAAHTDNLAALNNDSMTLDEKNAVNDTFHSLRESVVNELLARYPKSTPAKSDGKPATDGTKGATGAAIIERFLANRNAGMDDTANKKEIETVGGFSRGTIGAVILAWQKANGEK